MSSSPSSVSGAAPASTFKRYSMFVDEDRLTVAERDPDGKYVLYDDVAKLLTAPAASREEPSDVPNEQALAFFDKLASESWLIASAWRVVRDALAAFSSPSAASPEAKPQHWTVVNKDRVSVFVAWDKANADDEAEYLNQLGEHGPYQVVPLYLHPAPPIPSREDVRDAARLDLLESRAAWLTKGRDWTSSDRNADVWTVGVKRNDGSYCLDVFQGRSVREALDAALAAVSHPEAQTNGN